MSKRNQKHRVRNRVLRMEKLEPVICLSFWGWATDTFNTYVVPIANTIVETGKAIVETTVKVVDTFVDEVNEHVVQPTIEKVADTAHKVDKQIEKATDAVFDAGVKVASGIYNGIVITASSIVDLAVDVASVSAVGVAINPDNAAKTVEKWVDAGIAIAADPGKLADAFFDQYSQEYGRNGAAGVAGMLSVEIVSTFVGVGEVSAAAKAVKVSKIPSRLAKVADIADDIATDVAKVRRSTTVMADTGRAVGSSYSSKAEEIIMAGKPGNVKLAEFKVNGETFRVRADFSGHRNGLTDPHINVEPVNNVGKAIKLAHKKDVLPQTQLSGFNGMQYGGRRSTTVNLGTTSRR